MASLVPKVLDEITQIKFDWCNQSHCFTVDVALGFVKGLQTSADKASLLFHEVVASRCIISKSNRLIHEQTMWFKKGPFTSEQILKMITIEKGILNDDWYQQMKKCSKVSILHEPCESK